MIAALLALDPRLATSFTAGLLAAINPCGFILLPTYLMYFLGMENLRPGAERSSVPRALAVGVSVSAGFFAVFVLIGAVTRWLGMNWFVDQAPYVSLAIGLLLVALGIAMLCGYRLPFTTPKLDIGRRDRSVVSMFVFGLAYAVASIGCTIGPFLSVVLGTVTTDGVTTGIGAIGMYGLGMALIVVGLTVTLALANTAMLVVLRRGMQWFEYLAGALVLFTGLYLSWYWYLDIREDYDDAVVEGALGWQEDLARFVQRNQTAVVTLAVAAITVAVAVSVWMRRRHEVPA